MLTASDPAKIAEEDLLDLNPSSAPSYWLENSLLAQLLKEPRADRKLEREGKRRGRLPRALLFPQS
jgi:hypothetical protein